MTPRKREVLMAILHRPRCIPISGSIRSWIYSKGIHLRQFLYYSEGITKYTYRNKNDVPIIKRLLWGKPKEVKVKKRSQMERAFRRHVGSEWIKEASEDYADFLHMYMRTWKTAQGVLARPIRKAIRTKGVSFTTGCQACKEIRQIVRGIGN